MRYHIQARKCPNLLLSSICLLCSIFFETNLHLCALSTQAYYYCIFVSLPQIFKHCFTLCRLFPLYWANGRDRQFYTPSTQFHILILNLFMNFINSFITGWKHFIYSALFLVGSVKINIVRTPITVV